MVLHFSWSAIIVIALTIGSPGFAWPQQSSPPQPPMERDDPATSGAGPTSGAPGQHNYDPPKSGSVTYDSRGVTTFQPSIPKTDGPADPPSGKPPLPSSESPRNQQ
jgi:hypothetical protein